jgi:hypothetical protein
MHDAIRIRCSNAWIELVRLTTYKVCSRSMLASRCQIKRSYNRARNTPSKDGGLRMETPRLQADDDQQDHNLADLFQGAENVPGLAADMLV